MGADDSKTDKSSTWPAILGVSLSAFFLGALVVGYFFNDGLPEWMGGPAAENSQLMDGMAQGDEAGTGLPDILKDAVMTGAEALNQDGIDTAETSDAVERVEEQQGGLDQRLAAAEQRLARLDLQTQAASGNAARAEGLLIAFAARRTLEKGAELGYLGDQLKLRFGDALPNAVNTVVEGSRNPMTLDRLTAQLEGLEGDLTEANVQEATITRIRREFSQLFVIRRESSPSPRPQRRLSRAKLFLESGRVDSAIKEVEGLPGAENAAGWIEDAERYAEMQRALDLIETSAVLEPRRLRDRTGNRIEQPSPAGDAE